jgi:hypothetical protein
MILLSASSSHLVLFWTIPNLNKRTERSEEKKSTYPSDLCCLSSIRAVEKVSGAGRSRPRELSKSPYTHALPPPNLRAPFSLAASAGARQCTVRVRAQGHTGARQAPHLWARGPEAGSHGRYGRPRTHRSQRLHRGGNHHPSRLRLKYSRISTPHPLPPPQTTPPSQLSPFLPPMMLSPL